MAFHEDTKYNNVTKLSLLMLEPSKQKSWDSTNREPRLKETSENEFLDSLSQNRYDSS